MDKTDLPKVMEKISKIYGYFDKKNDEEKIKIIESYFTELKQYSCKQVLRVIDSLSVKSKYVPSVAEIKMQIEQDDNTLGNANLNSCYWYEIEREYCEKNNIPYYDITKGPDYPLPPYRD